MIKTHKIEFLAIAVLVIAVATILITPDLTDDVDGLLHPHKVVKMFEQASTIATALSAGSSLEQSYLNSSSQTVLQMVPTYRC